MKKWLLILGMITCMAGLTACGEKEEVASFMSQADAETYATENITAMNQVVTQGYQDQITDSIWIAALDSWESASEDMGSFEEVLSVTVDLDDEEGTVDATIKGSERNAVVEFVFDNQALTGVSVNVEYTFAEKMEKAALNTLLGMGTVFVVLILLSYLIQCFTFIPKLEAAFSKKPQKTTEAEKAVDKTIAQIVEKEESAPKTDDLQLVAVIAAAVAASEGAAATDGFVVRSIKKRTWR